MSPQEFAVDRTTGQRSWVQSALVLLSRVFARNPAKSSKISYYLSKYVFGR
ncbi:hypothetical protein ACVWZK_008575 [Bradyrhizobium sp. GM0.4]